MCIDVLIAYMSVYYMYTWYLWKSESSTRFHETGSRWLWAAALGHHVSWYWESNVGPLKELLTVETTYNSLF